jgi:hypothetical protein
MTEAVSADLPRWCAVRAALDDFQGYLSHQVASFRIIAANDSWWDDDEYKRLRAEGFPSRLRGLYLIYDDTDELLYVGVALVNYDKRVWSHDALFTAWEVKRRWTDIIPLEPQCAFLGLSLEYFLICRLSPKCNTSYKGYEIPVAQCEAASPTAAEDRPRPPMRTVATTSCRYVAFSESSRDIPLVVLGAGYCHALSGFSSHDVTPA